MIVVMAAGLAANLTWKPARRNDYGDGPDRIASGRRPIFLTVQKTLAAFALGMTLFLTTLFLNFIAFYLVKHYRERHA